MVSASPGTSALTCLAGWYSWGSSTVSSTPSFMLTSGRTSAADVRSCAVVVGAAQLPPNTRRIQRSRPPAFNVDHHTYCAPLLYSLGLLIYCILPLLRIFHQLIGKGMQNFGSCGQAQVYIVTHVPLFLFPFRIKSFSSQKLGF